MSIIDLSTPPELARVQAVARYVLAPLPPGVRLVMGGTIDRVDVCLYIDEDPVPAIASFDGRALRAYRDNAQAFVRMVSCEVLLALDVLLRGKR